MRRIQCEKYVIVFLLGMIIFGVRSEAFAFNKKTATIIKISDIKVVVKQNDKLVLPKTVTATMNDKSTKKVSVKWDTKSVDTSRVYIDTVHGSVNGYTNKVKLSICVNAYIKSVEDIEATIRDNGEFNLPKTLAANMSDGSTKKIPIEWKKVDLDYKKIGESIYSYKVENYEKPITIKIMVLPTIVSIDTINITIKMNESFSLPIEIPVKMSDGSIEKKSVEWDSNNFDTKKIGIYNFLGKVDNYKGNVSLNLVVEKLNIQDIAKEGRKVYLIKAYNNKNKSTNIGSGFVISDDGILVTNYHVIDCADNIQAIDYNNKIFDVGYVIGYDKFRDIVALKLNSSDKFENMTLGNSDTLELGQDVVAIGSPLGLQNTVSNGLISSIRESDRVKGAKDLQISVPISSGSSGGALLNMFGEVVGITYAGYINGQNINFAIPINEIKLLGSKMNISLNQLYEREHIIIGIDSRYEGDTKNGKQHGFGYSKWNDGAEYTGYWKDGIIDGEGTMKFAGGGVYEGAWENGKMHGYGIYTAKDGIVVAGNWINNEYQVKKPNAPSEITAWAVVGSTICINWKEADDAILYYVYYSQDGVDWHCLENADKSKKFNIWREGFCASLSNNIADSTMYIKVTAVKQGVESDPSSIITVDTQIKNYPEIKTAVPMLSSGSYYTYYNNENTRVFYEYKLSTLSSGCEKLYVNLLKSKGWNFFSSSIIDGGILKVYKNGSSTMAYIITSTDFTIVGDINK